ncbi:MAG TPA: TIGR03089 family protein [Actinocrinis sp.]|uniref:TIGR03089 family protein n=1 Tax=Actinocrinis sp. TaxID=1920516 RepID=UPI002DDD40B3|nr:TIGR03089 family protein [Actinocrinis sp.]HEV2347733.1 TIGR03089 family protein [Actinocrinis sp.]
MTDPQSSRVSTDRGPVRHGFTDLAAVWRARAAADAGRPFLTFLDDGTGERVELSYTTFGNWLAKTANLVQDDLMAGPGDRISVCAPPHWLTAVWMVAPLLAGSVVEPWGEAKSAHTVIAGPDAEVLGAARDCPGERLALSLLPLGRPFDVVPDGFRDYSAEVRGFGDRFTPFTPSAPGMEALVVDATTLTHGELIERAAFAASAVKEEPDGPSVGLGSADRLLVDARGDRFTGSDVISWLFAPLIVGAGVVIVRAAAADRLDRIAETERVTHRLTVG